MIWKAGDFKHRIELLARTLGEADVYGRHPVRWVCVATAYAHVRDMSAREYLLQDAALREVITTFTIRYHPGITAGMRVRFAGQDMDILYIDHMQYKARYMALKCRLIEGEDA